MDIPGDPEELIVEFQIPIEEMEDIWTCRVTIRKGVSVLAVDANAMDSLQAVMLAFDAAREKLKKYYPSSTWNGLPIDLAFPAHIPYVCGHDNYKHIEKYAEDYLLQSFPVTKT
jgi:hypothetical protein